jgi:uncharacterized protein YraI
MTLPKIVLRGLSALLLLLGVVAASSAAEAANATARRDVNLRTGPGSGFGRILTVPRGTSLTIRDCSGGWCRVKVFGSGGYLPNEALRGYYQPGYRPSAEVYIGRPYRDDPAYWDRHHHGKPAHWDRHKPSDKPRHHAKPAKDKAPKPAPHKIKRKDLDKG